jgi:carboxymethylenebutenolidase
VSRGFFGVCIGTFCVITELLYFSMADATCCPPGSLPYLATSYEAKGTVVTLDSVQLYLAPIAGSPEKAILIFPDVWGWNGGRVRAIADSLGAQGYIVAVGKFLSPPHQGGTDGDALPPGGAFDLGWMSGFPWPIQKPKADAALAHLRSLGAKRIGVLGFCYGGHPACWASSENADIACGAVLHPSMQLEAGAFGGKVEPLLESVRCPFLLAPAGNDLPMWSADGEFGQALSRSTCGAEHVFKPFPEMQHGWSCRGNVEDPKVKRDVGIVMEDVLTFFAKHLT